MRILTVAFTLALFIPSIAVGAGSIGEAGGGQSVSKPAGTLAQVMRGIYFPNANLIFDVQQNDPGVAKKTSGEPAGSATETYAGMRTPVGKRLKMPRSR